MLKHCDDQKIDGRINGFNFATGTEINGGLAECLDQVVAQWFVVFGHGFAPHRMGAPTFCESHSASSIAALKLPCNQPCEPSNTSQPVSSRRGRIQTAERRGGKRMTM